MPLFVVASSGAVKSCNLALLGHVRMSPVPEGWAQEPVVYVDANANKHTREFARQRVATQLPADLRDLIITDTENANWNPKGGADGEQIAQKDPGAVYRINSPRCM